jgi:BMFP domain-containing protein YqiC
MDNIQEKTNKLSITESVERELRMYFFITKFIEEFPDGRKKITEGVASILSFDLDRAVAEANISLPVGTNIIMAGNRKISEILSMVDMVNRKETEIKEPVAVKTTKELGKEEFKHNLLLAADTMVADERDKKIIKRIVSKIV